MASEEEECVNETDYDFDDEELFQRCGTELTEEKLAELLKDFEENTLWKRPILGTPEAGTVVDGYTIIKQICSGGFGTVCLAEKKGLYFALKFVHVNKSQTAYDKEFKILHNLLKSKDYQQCLTSLEWKQWKEFDDEETRKTLVKMRKNVFYMVLRLAGPSLKMLLTRQLREKNCAFSIPEGIPIMKRALKALQLFHDMTHVHLDIKLDNFAIDITNDDRVLLLDYGMGTRAPHVEEVEKSFQGTRFYASRRALANKAQSYRDDYEAWFNSLLKFQTGEFPWGNKKESIFAANEEKEDFWSKPSIQPLQWNQIMTHIDLLNFRETMNFDFIQQCLQNIIDTDAGIPLVPYLYARTDKNGKAIVHGRERFGACKDDKKGRKRFICTQYSCNYTIFVMSADCQKAEEGTEAVIVDTLNHHTCTSTTT